MGSKVMALYKKLKVAILAIVNTLVMSFAPEDVRVLVLGIINGVFVIVDAIMQYKYPEETKIIKVVKKANRK